AWAVPFILLACGGSEPSAQSPDQAAAAPAAEPAAEPAPAAAEGPAAAPAANEGGGWEGEDSAKSGSPAAPSEAATPNPDTKGEETRTVEVISKLVKDQRQPVRDCYDKARKDIPDLKGDMVIHFVLDPKGNIKNIELNVERSTLKSPPVADCAIKVIKGIKFPASSRGMDTTVNYPYNFNPR
ncbi:MAG TPA: AgmX/PglI C-terminal domain-containing protein, partial [Polyangiaceae bacterium]|nr:AgmX/PglI C-terminal domain-containing protein [Polyangiaceae bacterium]